jgi:hypothetical protein
MTYGSVLSDARNTANRKRSAPSGQKLNVYELGANGIDARTFISGLHVTGNPYALDRGCFVYFILVPIRFMIR